MITLCGTTYPAEPSFWPPLAVASVVYLVPTLAPWRSIALLICCAMLAFLVPVLADIFLWPRLDICDPPYFLHQLRRIGIVAMITLAITTYFLTTIDARPFAWGRPIALRLLIYQYAAVIAVAIASVLVSLLAY